MDGMYVFDGIQLGHKDRDTVMYCRARKKTLGIQITDECREAEG